MGTRAPVRHNIPEAFNPTLIVNGGTLDQCGRSAHVCSLSSHAEPPLDGEAIRSMEERYGIREEGMF